MQDIVQLESFSLVDQWRRDATGVIFLMEDNAGEGQPRDVILLAMASGEDAGFGAAINFIRADVKPASGGGDVTPRQHSAC